MALEIYIDNTPIPFSDDLSLSLHYKNPLFLDSKVNEAYSYSFTLPASPILNSILKNSKRVDAKSRLFILNGKIKMNGCLLLNGKIQIKKSSNQFYSCNIYNEGRNLYKETSENHISEFDFGELEVLTEAEIQGGASLLTAWSDLVGKTNDANPEEGRFKFPLIKAFYDDIDDDESNVQANGLNYLNWKGGGINQAGWQPNSPLQQGSGFLLSQYKNDGGWVNTFSPCLRMDFVIRKLLENFGYTIQYNELDSIQEYKRLVFYSGYACDELQSTGSGGDFLQIYGRKYKLSDFTPDTNGWKAFQTIIEMFSAVFYIDNNLISIRLSKNMLNQKAIDKTSQANPESIIEEGDTNKTPYFKYNLEENDYLILNNLAINTFSYANDTHWMYHDTGEVNENATTIEHLPLQTIITRQRYLPFWMRFYQGPGDVVGNDCNSFDEYYFSFAYLQAMADFNSPGDYLSKNQQLKISSRVYPDANDKPNQFLMMVFHGRAVSSFKYTSVNIDGTCSLDDPSGPRLDLGIYLVCNLENTSHYNFSFGIDTDHPNIYVSDKTIYLNDKENESKGTYKNYLQDLAEFTTNNEEVQKNLYLQPYEIYNLSLFENIRHRIQSPEGNFEGVVKEFKVTISKNSISPTTVTYIKQIYED